MDTSDPAPACPGAASCTSEPIYHELLARWKDRGLTLPGTTVPVRGLATPTYGSGAAPTLVATARVPGARASGGGRDTGRPGRGRPDERPGR
ncbi:hypothetical protein AB0K43_11800 [Kitasatospora sp. NPDC049258]|uniref:hypothetical protein n=1 Tax=Kitasatospora sp. NPDC049258 TaxID=3155394 RepID=UPI003434327C